MTIKVNNKLKTDLYINTLLPEFSTNKSGVPEGINIGKGLLSLYSGDRPINADKDSEGILLVSFDIIFNPVKYKGFSKITYTKDTQQNVIINSGTLSYFRFVANDFVIDGDIGDSSDYTADFRVLHKDLERGDCFILSPSFSIEFYFYGNSFVTLGNNCLT